MIIDTTNIPGPSFQPPTTKEVERRSIVGNCNQVWEFLKAVQERVQFGLHPCFELDKWGRYLAFVAHALALNYCIEYLHQNFQTYRIIFRFNATPKNGSK
jgi:hypothetical protein